MHNFIKRHLTKTAVIFLAIFLLASCGSGVGVESVDKSYSTDTIFVDAKIPRLTGLSDKEFQERINDEYEDIIEELLEEFTESAKETGDSSTFSVTTTEFCNDNGFLSVVTEIESCMRNARKMHRRIGKNIDTRECKEVPLSGLFSDDSYIDMINARLCEAVAGDHEKYSGLWAQPKLCENQDYYIKDGTLVLYYPPYELSYYERGFVEIPLSLEDMSGYLKPEYRKLIMK